MNFKEIKNNFESLNNLGFSERKLFNILSNKENISIDILDRILSSNVYFDKETITKYQEKIKTTISVRTSNAFTDKIKIDDFEKLNFKELLNRIENIWDEPDWGSDLETFKDLFSNSIRWIKQYNLEDSEFYFLYNEFINDPKKLIEHNFFNYSISIISISKKHSKIAIINHGGD